MRVAELECELWRVDGVSARKDDERGGGGDTT